MDNTICRKSIVAGVVIKLAQPMIPSIRPQIPFMNQKARQNSTSFLGGKYNPATAAPKLKNAQAINPTVKDNKIGGSMCTSIDAFLFSVNKIGFLHAKIKPKLPNKQMARVPYPIYNYQDGIFFCALSFNLVAENRAIFTRSF